VFNFISDFQVHSNAGIFSLIDKQAVKELNQLKEKNRFLPGLRSWVGFEQDVVYHDRTDRTAGKPKQTFRRLFKYAFDAIFSFSYKPLRIMTAMGITISVIGFVMASFFIVRRILGIEIAQTGFNALLTLVLFLGGVQLIAIGLIGEYLARVYDEVKERPLYIVKKIYKGDISDLEG
jgi:dolichol-phosphate mannosyltransferase